MEELTQETYEEMVRIYMLVDFEVTDEQFFRIPSGFSILVH